MLQMTPSGKPAGSSSIAKAARTEGAPVGFAALSSFGFAQSLIIIRHVLSFLET